MCHRQIKITTYDRLLRAWENSMEAVREFSKLCRFDGGQRQSKTGFLLFCGKQCKASGKTS